MAAARTGLVYPDGRTVHARDIAALRARASLASGGYGGYGAAGSPWAYDGAQPRSQTMLNWMPSVRSPDSELNYDRDRMVGRARDLYRNDPWARGSVQRIVDSAVGAHFFPVPQPNWRVLQRQLGAAYDETWAREWTSAAIAEFRMWADDPNHWCDVMRRQSFSQICAQALTSKLVEGESTAMLPWMLDRRTAGAARYATCVQMIDPDRLSNPNEQVDTHNLRGGVEIDGLEAPVAYWFRRAHQYDYYDNGDSMTWDRFPRETPWGRRVVIHDFDQERATRHRGVSLFAPILARARMLARFDDVTLQAATLRTVMAMFVKSPYDQEQIQAAMDGGYEAGQPTPGSSYQELRFDHHAGNPVEVGGVQITPLAPGEDIGVVGGMNGAGENYDAFESAFLRSFAANSGQSTEEISNDFRKVNYSSFRGSMLQAWKTLHRRRRDFASGFCDPIYSGWVEEFVDRNPDLMPAGFDHDTFVDLRPALVRAKWIGPGRGWVDPVKERQGEVLGLDAGFGTLEATCADISGEWWEDVLDRRKAEIAAFRERGIPLPEVFHADAQASQEDKKPVPV